MSATVGYMTTSKRRGRPAGLLINPDAARHILGDRPQTWWATESGMSTAHLSEILKGSKGCTPEAAGRIAAALDVVPGVLFPELVEFRVEARVFTASAATVAAA